MGMLLGLPGHGIALAANDIERGEYLTAASGCLSCHTDSKNDGAAFAGGYRIETPYGIFITPNITPDAESGIGRWTEADFLAAMKDGEGPEGEYYYPAFPYPSYAGLTDQDVLDIRAYLATVEPVAKHNEPHELEWYIPGRWAMGIWQWLFAPWEYPATPDSDLVWQRGAYLARHLGHCGECHTPRNIFGALNISGELAGSPKGSSGGGGPNLTVSKEQGLGDWTKGDLELFLELGMKPNGDFAGGGMTTVIDDNTSQLTPDDRAALILFLRNLPAH